MKQLFINEKATTLFFETDISFDEIFQWIFKQVMFSESNIFNLSEKHSCCLDNGNSENEVVISGDEDFVTITIEEITPVKI